jgi:hypothetical protein
MSFSAAIVQGRPARSGFGPLDGGDLGPTRCAVTKRGSHEGTHRAHHLPGLPPSAIISAGETGEPRVRDGQDFSARATLRYRAQRFLPDFAPPCARPRGGLLSGSNFDSG